MVEETPPRSILIFGDSNASKQVVPNGWMDNAAISVDEHPGLLAREASWLLAAALEDETERGEQQLVVLVIGTNDRGMGDLEWAKHVDALMKQCVHARVFAVCPDRPWSTTDGIHYDLNAYRTMSENIKKRWNEKNSANPWI